MSFVTSLVRPDSRINGGFHAEIMTQESADFFEYTVKSRGKAIEVIMP